MSEVIFSFGNSRNDLGEIVRTWSFYNAEPEMVW